MSYTQQARGVLEVFIEALAALRTCTVCWSVLRKPAAIAMPNQRKNIQGSRCTNHILQWAVAKKQNVLLLGNFC
jgi:hypothetical protein